MAAILVREAVGKPAVASAVGPRLARANRCIGHARGGVERSDRGVQRGCVCTARVAMDISSWMLGG